MALFQTKIFNIAQLATVFATQVKIAPNSNRSERFLAQFEVGLTVINRLVVSLM